MFVFILDKCVTGLARLVVGEGDQYYRGELPSNLEDIVMFYTVDDKLLSGRVEYCYNGSDYITVCSDIWDNTEASVLCEQLGFSSYGKCENIALYPIMFPSTVSNSQHIISHNVPFTLRYIP